MNVNKPSIEQFWKDDFVPLEKAGKEILHELREDEAEGDVHRRMVSHGSHKYFLSKSAFQHVQSSPLPPQLEEEIKKVRHSLEMGVFSEAKLAWTIVDNKLFLWCIEAGQDFMNVEVQSGQTIVSAGLAPPKKGVFKETVEWCLVVTTLDEVLLFALQRQDGRVRLVQTHYNIPTDSIPTVSVCGLPDGRIFMGGYDGSLSEFAYESLIDGAPDRKTPEEALSDFYDGSSTSIGILKHTNRSTNALLRGGKRALTTAFYERPRKCRKLDHSTNGLKALAKTVVPGWFLRIPSALFGSEKMGSLDKIVHDEERKCLYTLSKRGFINAYDLRDNKIAFKASLDCVQISRQYLSAVARGHMFVASSSIEFAGGGVVAQAGVGGMEGARSILKLTDPDNSGRSGILNPIEIHVLGRSESSRLTLLAITAGGLRYYLTSLSSSLDKSNLAPSSKMTLCHIRAPPPIDPITGTCEESFDEDIPGSRTPRVFSDTVVDAAAYSGGHMFLALKKAKETNSTSTDEIGNVIIGTNTDLIARKITKKDGVVLRELPGGLTETVSVPSALFGGRIYNACAFRTVPNASVLKLMLNSQTPSDNELSNDLVPPFYPKVSRKDENTNYDGKALKASKGFVHSNALVQSNGVKASGSLIAMQVMSNFFLSRPLRYGLQLKSSFPPSADYSREPLYRISTRYGTSGFSFTASGKVRSAVSVPRSKKSNKSARLSPWLQRPAMIPLSDISLSHLLPCTTTVVTSLGGLHYFKSSTILQALGEILLKAGPSLESDKGVIAFYNNYGAKQFCTLCLTLGLGCGPTKGNSSMSDELERRAKLAAFKLGGRPKVTKKDGFENESDDVIVVENADEPLIPNGYEFSKSFLSAGLTSISSRLLRPIWFKPAVVVTEGPRAKLPAKVEILLDEATLANVRSPIFRLKQLVKDKFQKAVATVPGVHSVDSSQMEIDDTNVLTQSMQFRGALRLQSTASGTLSQEDADTIACLIEERNIHSMFRLLSRVVQLLDLLSLLSRAQLMPDLPEVEWGSLHGLTISQLVQSRGGQERVERLLNSLVSSSNSTSCTDLIPTADSDEIAKKLASECYLYFSPGSRYAYLGFRAAKEALRCVDDSARRLACVDQSVEKFLTAASFWTNAQLVTGRLMHSGEIETYTQKAHVALRYDSPLARAAEILLKLQQYVAIVDICSITASNFSGKNNFGALTDAATVVYPWENMLYHNRKSHFAASGEESNQSKSEVSSNSIVLGTSVTPEDAVSTCHAIILYNLLIVLNGPSSDQSKKMMVSACAASTDQDFLKAFFRNLIDTKHQSILLKIDSLDLERWLKDNNDYELMWKYYVAQRKHVRAGELMWEKATEMNENSLIEDRIRCLERSKGSYTSAIDAGNNRLNGDNAKPEEIKSKSNLVGEYLDIARLQHQTLTEIKCLELTEKLTEEKLEKIKKNLLPVNDLYNDYAAELNLFDMCLRIMLSCRHDETATIERLWKSIICQEILPCYTRSEATYNFLQNILNDSLIEERVVLLSEGDSASLPSFESGDWLERLREKVEALGKDLIGKGANYVCPVDFLVSIFEGLRHALQHGSDSSPWPLDIFVRINVPYLDLLDAYGSVIEREQVSLMGGADPYRRYLSLKSVLELLEKWISISYSGDNQNNRAYQELSNAVVSRSLLNEIGAFESSLDGLNKGRDEIQTRLEQVKERIQRL
mmetsp:Transcript_26949/g.40789  ORF Transcript_26949/g.40789 Transcript_26949/m.40789 type:complete len:1699 (+) Transcript_26949:181-5277(+)